MSSQLCADNAIEALQYQINNCATKNLYTKHGSSNESSVSRPINADIGKFVRSAVM